MGTIEVRKAEADSLDAALQLLQRFFREEGFHTCAEEMRSSLYRMMIQPNSAVFLAWHGTKALGVATVTTSVGIEYGRSAEIEDLYVLPQARGGGVATALIETACAWCRQEGCTAVLITVTPEGEARHDLIEFYGRRGFANTGRTILERTLHVEFP